MVKPANGKPRKAKVQLVTETNAAGKPYTRHTAAGDKKISKALRGNRNTLRHGLRGGTLPKDAKYIEFRLNGFRRTLEDAVLQAKGEVTIVDAAVIQTCLRWERHAALAQRWLVKEGSKLSAADRLRFSEAIAKASRERDKALSCLELDVKPDPWSTITLPAPEATP